MRNWFPLGRRELPLDSRRWIELSAKSADGFRRRRLFQEFGDCLGKFAVAHGGSRLSQLAEAESADDLVVAIVVSTGNESADAREQGGNRHCDSPSTLPVALDGDCCQRPLKMKTPPTSEDIGGIFHAFTFFKAAALESQTAGHRVRSDYIADF